MLQWTSSTKFQFDSQSLHLCSVIAIRNKLRWQSQEGLVEILSAFTNSRMRHFMFNTLYCIYLIVLIHGPQKSLISGLPL